MKYKKILITIFVITGLILFLKRINILQVENKLGNPLMMVLLIIIFSAVAIQIQKSIDSNYKDGRIHYDNLDILKYICSILIVFLHSRPFLNFSDQLDLAFNNIITRICVPIFFVITGYFVAKKEKDNPNYIKDYIKKMIPLYLVWNILYVPVMIATILEYAPIINQYLSNFSIPLLLLLLTILLPIAIFISLLYTGIYYHLWYFPAVMLSLVVLNK